MICSNCHCEIGNLTECPYCGSVNLSSVTRAVTGATNSNVDLTQTDSSENARHINNIDSWGLMTVILLGGIFIMEFLQLLMNFMR